MCIYIYICYFIILVFQDGPPTGAPRLSNAVRGPGLEPGKPTNTINDNNNNDNNNNNYYYNDDNDNDDNTNIFNTNCNISDNDINIIHDYCYYYY